MDTTQTIVEKLVAIFGDDPQTLKDISRLFLEQCDTLLADMRKAIDTQNVEKLSMAAHTFKGSALSFGLETLSKQAQSLETMGKTKNMSKARNALKSLIGSVEEIKPLLIKLCA